MEEAFTLTKNQLAQSPVSENDRLGGGSASAAPIAQKIIEAYWRFKGQRQEQVRQDGADLR